MCPVLSTSFKERARSTLLWLQREANSRLRSVGALAISSGADVDDDKQTDNQRLPQQ